MHIDNEDLVKHDDLIKSKEHTGNDADTLISKEEEKKAKKMKAK
jgi:hypothetical protein